MSNDASVRASMQVTEVCVLNALPGSEHDLERAVAQALPLFEDAGAVSVTLARQVEEPTLYTASIVWRRIEDHLEGFRTSDAFGQWRALVMPHLATPPAATHFGQVDLSA